MPHFINFKQKSLLYHLLAHDIMSAEEKKEVSKVKIGDQKIDFKDELLRHQIRVLLGLEQLTSDEDVHEIEQN